MIWDTCILRKWENHFLGRLIRRLGVPKERGVWNSQGGRKDKLFFLSLHSLRLSNNNVSCLRTVSGLTLLANSVILKCKLWKKVWWGLYNLQTFFGFIGEYITSLLTLARGSDACVRSFLYLLYTLIKLYYTKALSNQASFVSGPGLNSSPLEAKNPGIFLWFSNNLSASACNEGDSGSILGLGRYPGEGNGNLLQYSCLENSMDGGSW